MKCFTFGDLIPKHLKDFKMHLNENTSINKINWVGGIPFYHYLNNLSYIICLENMFI